MKTPNSAKVKLCTLVKGTPTVCDGALPGKYSTVTAEVLCRLLSGQKMTGMDAVEAASTTRLAAVVHYLENAYGWIISRRSKVLGCVDGHVAEVSEYWLDRGVIAKAMTNGASDWCRKVRASRKALRTFAAYWQTGLHDGGAYEQG